MADSLKIDVLEDARWVVLSPRGEIGFQEATSLRTHLRQAFERKPGRVVADLSGVSYMSSPGLATLVEALQLSKRQSTPFYLCGLTGRVRAIFEIAKLQTVFTIVGDVAAAQGQAG